MRGFFNLENDLKHRPDIFCHRLYFLICYIGRTGNAETALIDIIRSIIVIVIDIILKHIQLIHGYPKRPGLHFIIV